ncbi:GNAT family N-acetyltransferase [Streptomyces sp. NPDC097619]|uniref:GNAT family N-acetyltransferase n=1 Tax=Streptomyces sp. NPDC097619 TaxID=3157228 RepID=UPI003324BBF8
MTTTLRPTGPLQQNSDGARARAYEICVNSRHVGVLELASDTQFGPSVGVVRGLAVDGPDRRRGRATVAALAAEEVLRSWGCTRVRASVPAGAEGAHRLVTALGYRELSRNMVKELVPGPRPLPPGAAARPIAPAEYEDWSEAARAGFAQDWVDRGMTPEAARAKSDASHAELLPRGLDTPGTWIRILEADGERAGQVWVAAREVAPGRPGAYVFDVEVPAGQRGRGHGRTLMLLAEGVALEAGAELLGLHVFAGNAPALGLYASLGYVTTERHYGKDL